MLTRIANPCSLMVDAFSDENARSREQYLGIYQRFIADDMRSTSRSQAFAV